MLQQVSQSTTTEQELSQKVSLPYDIVHHIVTQYGLIKEEKERISDSERVFLQQVFKKGTEGINPKDFPGHRNLIDKLIKTEHLVVIDKELLWHADVFTQYTHRTMKHFECNKELTLQQAKERTGLSRKYIIPLLNAMEQKNLVKRYGEVRIKV